MPPESRTCLLTRSTAMIGSDMEWDVFRGSTRLRSRAVAFRRPCGHCRRGSRTVAWPRRAGAVPLHARWPSRTKVLVVGDSLSAEYGIAARQRMGGADGAAPAQGEGRRDGGQRQHQRRYVVGRAHALPALLSEHKPTHVIIELGANDALRGLPLAMTRDNLAAMVRAARAAGAQVLLVGMRMPPNYGRSTPRSSRRCSSAGQGRRRRVGAVLAGRRCRFTRSRSAVPGRSHPPQRQGAHDHLDNVWPVLRTQLKP